MSVDKKRIGLAIIAIAVAAPAAFWGQPLIHNNATAINVLVTVFSVLAGFLVAIVAIVGDPALLPPGSWRAAHMGRDKLKKRLIRHRWLFTTYLLTLGLVFSSLLANPSWPALTVWLERSYLFFGVVGFVFSLFLPSALMKAQEERINAAIESKRQQQGIQSILPPGAGFNT